MWKYNFQYVHRSSVKFSFGGSSAVQVCTESAKDHQTAGARRRQERLFLAGSAERADHHVGLGDPRNRPRRPLEVAIGAVIKPVGIASQMDDFPAQEAKAESKVFHLLDGVKVRSLDAAGETSGLAAEVAAGLANFVVGLAGRALVLVDLGHVRILSSRRRSSGRR